MKIGGMIIFHLGEISCCLANEFAKLVKSNKNQPILLLVNSIGGCVDGGIKIIRAIRRHGQVTGLVTGDCHSIALPILQACQQRLILPHSTLLLHSIAVSNIKVLDCVNGNSSEINEAYRQQITVEKLIAKRAHQKPSLIREFCEEEKTICANEALELGFVDRIFNFSLP